MKEYKELLNKIIHKKNLKQNEASALMDLIMTGKLSSVKIAALLVALRSKGETEAEIIGMIKAIMKQAVKIKPKTKNLLDNCGTGGDSSNTFNISTIASFISAGAGVNIAKHGNRAVSSKCGSADLLEKLGVNINLTPQKTKQCIEEIGIGFLFAPNFHSSLKFAKEARVELGIRTIFNVLGPLLNPALTKRQLVGVYEKPLVKVFANVLKKLGAKRAIIVHSYDGIDEISISDKTYMAELKENGKIIYQTISPIDFGLKLFKKEDLVVRDLADNLKIAKAILENKLKDAKYYTAIINSATTIYLAGLANNFKDATSLAEKSISSFKALQKLEQLIDFSNKND